MDLSAIQTALTAWVETYAGIQCEWGRQPQQIHEGAFVLAYLGAITKAGHDERIQVYDFDTDTTSVTVVGVRRLTLRLSFRSFDQRLGGSGRQYAENFRVALHSQSSWDTLKTAELSYIDSGELVDTDYIWSGRMVSQTDMDVVLGLRASTADPLHDGSYIKYVNIDTQEYVVDEDDVVVADVSGDFVTVDTD
jgi:hypothetical protein